MAQQLTLQNLLFQVVNIIQCNTPSSQGAERKGERGDCNPFLQCANINNHTTRNIVVNKTKQLITEIQQKY
eukprot:2481191-Amphidinium_carterae.2